MKRKVQATPGEHQRLGSQEGRGLHSESWGQHPGPCWPLRRDHRPCSVVGPALWCSPQRARKPVNFQGAASSSCFLRDREPADKSLLSKAGWTGASPARAQSPQPLSKASKADLGMVVR